MPRRPLASQHLVIRTPPTAPSTDPEGKDTWDWENGRLRFYIDNETVPSVDLLLRELASVGKRDAVGNTATIGPFGNELFGKTAKTGGVYSTMRIPFGTSLRVTMTNAPSAAVGGIYWLIVRGVEALPVTLGGELTLPDQARLRVARNSAVQLAPQELITLASSAAGMAGALVNVFLDNNSTDFNFLEACVRFTADGAAAPIFLSSGTEDFFLSASYFDEGPFQTSQSGVTYSDGRSAVAMYKTHASRDYVVCESSRARGSRPAAGALCVQCDHAHHITQPQLATKQGTTARCFSGRTRSAAMAPAPVRPRGRGRRPTTLRLLRRPRARSRPVRSRRTRSCGTTSGPRTRRS